MSNCVCLIDWQKAFEHVNWSTIMQIPEVTGIDWREGKLISKLYVDQSIKISLDQGGDKKCEEWKRR
jgi:hypothetical protein